MFNWLKSSTPSQKSWRLALTGAGLVLVVLVLGAMARTVLAQGAPLGLDEFGAVTNLGKDTDLIGLIARIINIFLGFLGVVAVVLIIYAGWLWMTSKGDAQKIAKAKKIMAGAVIGLAIVLSAFAIANFIIRQIQNATGGGGYTCPGGTPPPCPPPILPGSYLVVRSQGPMGNNVKLCASVQATFSEAVLWSTVTPTNFSIQDADTSTPFTDGEYWPKVDSKNISFTHFGAEFAAETTYRVTLRSGLAGLRGVSNISLRTDKVWTFTTGTESDDEAPEVVAHQPPQGGNEVCRSTPIQIVFSEPMLSTSFYGNVQLLNDETEAVVPLSEPTFGNAYRIANFAIQEPLDAFTTYRVTLRGGPGGITDLCGIPLVEDYSWTFTTGEITDCWPSISEVSPNSRDYGQMSTITGNNLFLDGEVFINNYPADANSFDDNENILCWAGVSRDGITSCLVNQVRVRAPVGANTGPAYNQAGFNQSSGELHINVEGVGNSNSLEFTITSPYVDSLSPRTGGVGQFVTISGWNFGSVAGQVRFVRPDNTWIVGVPPDACDDWWTENEIVIKVPAGVAVNQSYRVEVRTATSGTNPNKRSNSESFLVTSEPPGPGICSILPDSHPFNGPWPIVDFTVTGERFGDTISVLTFDNNNSINSTTYTTWGENEIVAETPTAGGVNLLGSGRWPVQVKVGSKISNWKYFTVENDPNVYPRVVEYSGCANATQSPSPWKNSTSACGNAAISARFNVSMNPSTFSVGPSGTIRLETCGNNDTPETCTPYTDGFGDIEHLINSDGDIIGFAVWPDNNFEKDYWYRVTITTGVTSQAGNAMRQPYSWQFRVASENCPLFKVDVNPRPFNFISLGAQQEFSALPTSFTCNLINPAGYSWTWTSSNNASDPPPPWRIGLVGISKSHRATVESRDYTPAGKAAIVTASADGEGKSGTSNVTVSRPSSIYPQVVRYNACPAGGATQSPSPWENSTNACGNAAVSARFTMAMVQDSMTVSGTGTIRVQSCGPGGNTPPAICLGAFLGFGTTTYIPNGVGDSVIGFKASPINGFTVGNWYKATIFSGPPGTGVQGINGNSLTQDFVWHFKVASDNCPISNILIAPPTAYIRNLGDTANFVAMPVAANCNIIDGNKYTWNWTVENHPDDSGDERLQLLNFVDSNAVVEALSYTPKTPPRPARTIAAIPAENKTAMSNVYVSADFCTEDNDCPCGTGWSRCINGSCQPSIQNIEPDNGAAGSWVTISGCYFGSDQGRIFYFNNVEGIWPDPKICGPNTWTNNQVIIETPPNLSPTGPITLIRPDGGRTDSTQTYTYNSTLRPGLCLLAPTFHYESELDTPTATITLSGKAFGTSRNLGDPADNVNYYTYNPVTRTYTYKGSAVIYPSWSDAEAEAITPAAAISLGPNQVKLNKSYQYSNPLAYTIRKGSPVPPAEVLPRVIGVQPTPDITNVCRNTVVIIEFNRPVTNNTIRGGEFELKTPSPGCISEAPGGWKKWLAGLFRFILPAKADVYYCVAQGSLRASGTTIIFTPNQPLAPDALYRAKITSPRVDCFNSGGLCNWRFYTGSEICRIHSVSIAPPNFTFTSPGQSRNFVAQALAIDGLPLSATYSWELQDPENVVDFDPLLDLTLPNVDVSANNRNGEATLLATAEYNNPPYSSSAVGRAPLRVFICEEPWDFDILDFDTRLLYCRGRTGDPNLLPAFVGAQGPASGDLLRQYIFKHPTADEVVGLRIYSNTQRLSPRQWYQSRPDISQGNPGAAKVDGYDALRDPQTVYVGAVARAGNDLYSNIYVLSYSQGASAQTVNIYNQLVKEWIFNIGLDNDSQAKIQRDLVRLEDFTNLRGKLAGYAASHGNKYPTLPAGTFLPYRSTSAWSSWQAELGNALGSALPVDPINKFNGCPVGYNPNTCWNPTAPITPSPDQRFVCPAGSHIYQYSIGQGASGYALRANMETKGVRWMGNPLIIIGIEDTCGSYVYTAGSFDIMFEDENLEIDGGLSGWPPLLEPSLMTLKSTTNNESTLVWTTALSQNSNENFSYQVWLTPDIPGFSPDPNGWGVVEGADSVYTQYFMVSPPADGKWWYKVRAVSSESDNQSESQAVMIIKDSTPPNDPVCIPGGGDYPAAQTIICTATDQGDFKTTVDVHFTNGTVIPSCGSPIIANPASINTTTTLNVMACDAANNGSSVVTYIYDISSVVPKANLIITAQDGGGAPLAGVGVSIDAREIGNTPITTTVNLGSRSVNFSDNLACYRFSGDINPTQPMDVTSDTIVVGIFNAVAPGVVGSPSPANEAMAADVSSALSWSVAPCSTNHHVYFGASQSAVQNATTTSPEYRGETESSKFDPSPLQYNATYYWRIDSVNDAGVTKGNVWTFTTAAEPTAIIRFISRDSGGNTLTGAFARLGGVYVGATETTRSVTYGSHTASFDNNLACYSYTGLSPTQPMNISGDVTVTGAYNQLPPSATTKPSPENNATNVLISTGSLTWSAGGCTASFDIYFGTDEDEILTADAKSPSYKGNSTVPGWNIDLKELAYSTTYYWRIDALSTVGTTIGEVWNFTTQPQPVITLTLRAQDDAGNQITGATVRVDATLFSGQTPTSTTLTQGSHNVTYDNTLSCYTHSGVVNPTQPRNYTADTTVTGTYERTAPNKVGSPSPTNGATGVSLTPSLTWTAATCADTYRVYFGTNSNPTTLVATLTSAPYSYSPPTLNYSTTYYWRVDTVNKGRVTTGDVFSFTTAALPTYQINIRSIDDVGNEFTGAPVTVNTTPAFSGTTPATATVPQGTYSVGFGAVACYTFSSFINPPQPINYTSNTTVTGTYNRSNPGQVTSVGASPTNGATGVSLTPSLTWTAATCADTYRVYFGTSSNPTTLVATLTSAPYSYSPPTLNYSTTYYWRVDTLNQGRLTTGQVLSFTTQPPPLVTITIQTRDNFNATITGATARLDGNYVGLTQTSVQVNQHSNHAVTFDDTLSCYSYASTSPPQGMTYSNNTTVIGTFNRSNPGQVTSVGASPTNGATGVSLTPSLTWSAATCADTYRVYFGTSSNPTTLVATLTSAPYSYSPPTLNYSTTYYWRVDTLNQGILTTGQVLSFTTQPPPLVTITIQTRDNFNATITGATARLDGNYVGLTQTSVQVNQHSNHAVTFDDTLSCYSYASTSPPQGMTYSNNTTVIGTFNRIDLPEKTSNPNPTPGSLNQPIQVFLSWAGAKCLDEYHFYLGTDADGVMAAANISSPYYWGTINAPDTYTYSPFLAYSTTYYWRIDSHNSISGQTTKGDVWHFTTRPPW